MEEEHRVDAVGDEPVACLLYTSRVGDVEHGLCGAVVLLKPDDPRSGEQLGEVEDVADVRAPEGVDGLGVVCLLYTSRCV